MVVVDGKGVRLGKALGIGIPGGSQTRRNDPGHHRRPEWLWAGRWRQKPCRLIGDKAYDSDPLRARLKRRGIELIVPHKYNRVRKPTQDRRALRRYRKRWMIERTNAWLGNCQLIVR